MNLTSALFFRVLEVKDFDTWNNVRRHYLPTEYHTLFNVIEKHIENFHKLPTIEELKLEVRDGSTVDKIYALKDADIEIEPYLLLEYIKNEYAQKEALSQLDKWVDASMAFETAEEVVRHIQQIGVELESKIELTPPEESMQKINLFESEDDMAKRIVLGFNKDFDSRFQFLPTDYIMIGGKRGSGKSLTCSNIADTIVTSMNKKALFFSIEMLPREVLQRNCAIATGVPYFKIRNKNLDVGEWEKVVKYWSSRYQDGESAYLAYLKHRSFETFHTVVSKQPLVNAYVDIVYDSTLTLGRIQAEVQKRVSAGEEIGIIIIDYINKVKRIAGGNAINHLDWQEQIAVSNAFKTLAQDVQIPVFSPFQIDAQGEARFGKGILDSCDAAFNLTAHKGDINAISFETVKMRAADEEVFTSAMNWTTLKLGPHSIEAPQQSDKKGGFKNQDITVKTTNIYDN